jgi:SAM-dependent methyltransferase
VALRALASALGEALGRRPRVLEAGCGTGKWLADLSSADKAAAGEVYGLDFSAGMLAQAQRRTAALCLVRGRAGQLPFADSTFDLVYCVNAIHHFDAPRAFISEARRLLRPGGRLAVIGMDPHGRKESWYVYRYFEGVYETDLARFPAWHEVAGWMVQEGLTGVSRTIVEHYGGTHRGCAVLDDPFLRQSSCSQLALLSEEAYRAGLRRIKTALAKAEARGETLTFTVDTDLAMIEGRRGQ